MAAPLELADYQAAWRGRHSVRRSGRQSNVHRLKISSQLRRTRAGGPGHGVQKFTRQTRETHEKKSPSARYLGTYESNSGQPRKQSLDPISVHSVTFCSKVPASRSATNVRAHRPPPEADAGNESSNRSIHGIRNGGAGRWSGWCLFLGLTIRDDNGVIRPGLRNTSHKVYSRKRSSCQKGGDILLDGLIDCLLNGWL
jgi:hypothetical protein